MAEVEFKLQDITEHGYPHACVFCCSDEDLEVRHKNLRKRTSPLFSFLCFITGPLGWIVGVLSGIFRGAWRLKKMSFPVCEHCHTAGVRLKHRDLATALLGLLSFIWLINDRTFFVNWYGTAFIAVCLLFLYATIEHFWLGAQFRSNVVKMGADRVVLALPNDDYPSIYQRHMDTATLYGKVESLGAQLESPLQA